MYGRQFLLYDTNKSAIIVIKFLFLYFHDVRLITLNASNARLIHTRFKCKFPFNQRIYESLEYLLLSNLCITHTMKLGSLYIKCIIYGYWLSYQYSMVARWILFKVRLECLFCSLLQTWPNFSIVISVLSINIF